MKLIGPIALVAAVFASATLGLNANAVPEPWDQPAASLAAQVADILGPAQARLTIRNLSTISTDEIPAIRKLLIQDLKSHGVVTSGADSANTIRVSLSENAHERLWVAEVAEGNLTRVVMVRVQPGATEQPLPAGGLTLRKETVLTTSDQVLAALETSTSLIAVEPEQIVIYSHASGSWQPQKRIGIDQKRPMPRDPRAVIVPSQSTDGFTASLAGIVCTGSNQAAQPAADWTVRCHESDDPWTIVQASAAQSNVATQPVVSVSPVKAFYNAARDYFTGVVTPSLGVDLPPFYTAAQLIRSASDSRLLLSGIDGKMQIVVNGALKPVAGTRDWGSDFAALYTGCGGGSQIVVSGSGEAQTDSLRAFELPAQEAIPASAPLALGGSVTALWSTPDGKSILAVVRGADNQYEVDRVTALCN